jgi:signal transduction histidine kinase
VVLRRLVAAEETERGNVSRELHDRLGQDLTALKLGLQILRKHGARAPALREGVGNLESLADRLMQDMHRLAWELRPAALDDFGLEMALRRYVDEWAALSGVAVDFHSRGVTARRLAQEVETTLYRIARAALTNVFRHASAKRVSVLLQRRADHVSLIVEDDGRGFDATTMLRAPATQGKLGLLGMQERATLAGGSVEIESSPGAGTTVFVRLPLAFEPEPPKPAAASHKDGGRK